MRNLERNAISFLKKHCNGNSAISFSGGKDSLVALDLAVRAGIKRAVFCNTTIEFEETIEYVKMIKSFYNIKLDIVRAPKDFFEVSQEIGFPSRRMRWCCDVFKFGPIARYAKENGIEFFITGLRRNESIRRSQYLKKDDNPVIPVSQINPILEWTSEDVWNYIKKYNLFTNPLYLFFKRLGCWLCPYKTEKEWSLIEKKFPELIEKLNAELEMYADKLKIKDKEKFIKQRGWTSWASPQEKTPIGFYRKSYNAKKANDLEKQKKNKFALKYYGMGYNELCGSRHRTIDSIVDIFKNKNESELIYFGTEEREVKKICNLLPVLTNNFKKNGKHIKIITNGFSKRRLNILIEKAINCVGCGACLAVCKKNALYIENNSIKVNTSKCNNCGRCINTNIIKGACIARNYSNNRRTIISSD